GLGLHRKARQKLRFQNRWTYTPPRKTKTTEGIEVMFSPITTEMLMALTIKAIFDKNLDPDIKQLILSVAHKNGLLDANGEKTPKYFALMNGDLESLIRTVTSGSGLCSCGCGRNPAGRGKYATTACRKRMSRTLKRGKKEAA